MKRLALLLPLLALAAAPARAEDPATNASDSEDSIGATESGDFVYPDYPPWPFASHSEEGATGVRASLLVNSHPSFSGVELALGANDADETVGGQLSMVVNFGGDFSGMCTPLDTSVTVLPDWRENVAPHVARTKRQSAAL